MYAGEGLPLQRRHPGRTYGTCGPPPPLQPLGTYLAHPNTHPPLLQPLLWPPPPIQHGDRHGLGTALHEWTDGCRGRQPEAQGWVLQGWVNQNLTCLPFPKDSRFSCQPSPSPTLPHLWVLCSAVAVTMKILTGAEGWPQPSCYPGGVSTTDNCLESRKDNFMKRGGRSRGQRKPFRRE